MSEAGSPEPGSSRPYNFFGLLDQGDLDRLAARLDAAAAAGAAHTFVFGHYPLSTVRSDTTTDGRSVYDLLASASIYACGHLHTFLGAASARLARTRRAAAA